MWYNRDNTFLMKIEENTILNFEDTKSGVLADKNKDGKVTRKQLEVDFVCNLGSKRFYIQSAFSIPDEEKRAQEIRPFRKIDDSFKKIIVTKDIVAPYYDEHGILTVNVYDFLLNPECIEG